MRIRVLVFTLRMHCNRVCAVAWNAQGIPSVEYHTKWLRPVKLKFTRHFEWNLCITTDILVCSRKLCWLIIIAFHVNLIERETLVYHNIPWSVIWRGAGNKSFSIQSRSAVAKYQVKQLFVVGMNPNDIIWTIRPSIQYFVVFVGKFERSVMSFRKLCAILVLW